MERNKIKELDYLGIFKEFNRKRIYYSFSGPKRKEIMELLKDELSKEEKITFAFLYGSFLDESPFRDVDLGIFVKDPELLSPLYEFQLESRLRESTGNLFPIEVRIINKAPVTFLYHVIKGELIFCRDDDFCSDFMEIVAKKYSDLKHFLDHYSKEAYGKEV